MVRSNPSEITDIIRGCGGGTVVVIADREEHGVLERELSSVGARIGKVDGLESPVGIFTADEIKGLEFDHVIVVDPMKACGSDGPGLRLLYVVLTRATRRAGGAPPWGSPELPRISTGGATKVLGSLAMDESTAAATAATVHWNLADPLSTAPPTLTPQSTPSWTWPQRLFRPCSKSEVALDRSTRPSSPKPSQGSATCVNKWNWRRSIPFSHFPPPPMIPLPEPASPGCRSAPRRS